MKGIAGQRLLDHVVEALAGHLPTGVKAIRSRVGATGGLQIWAVAAGEQYGFWDTGNSPASRLVFPLLRLPRTLFG
jgi:hypothetical protein